MSDVRELIEGYLEMWNTADAAARSAVAARVLERDATYVDPLVSVSGIAEITGTVSAVQQQFPGMRFRLLGDVDSHHNVARFWWQLGTDETPDLVVGFDVAVISNSGRFAAVAGFLDKVPSAA